MLDQMPINFKPCEVHEVSIIEDNEELDWTWSQVTCCSRPCLSRVGLDEGPQAVLLKLKDSVIL